MDEDGNEIQDAINTLIFAITLHFVGDPANIKDKSQAALMNIKCKTLHNYRWYKETFFVRVMQMPDSNKVYWKVKFLVGLPNILAKKVREKVRKQYDGIIPYDNLTYGQLHSFVQKVGMKICKDEKLAYQRQKERKWLGNFCQQFDNHHKNSFRGNKTKKIITCKGQCDKTMNNRNKTMNNRKNHTKSIFRKEKKPFQQSKFSKTDKPTKQFTCFRCGKQGHIAKYCKISKGIRELNLDEEIIHKIEMLMIQSSYSYSSEKEMSDDNQIDEIKTSSENEINVLTKNQEFLLEAVNKIDDPLLRKEYLERLKNTFEKIDRKIETHKAYSFQNIIGKFKKQEKRKLTLEDLTKEIQQIKIEVKELKEQQKQHSKLLIAKEKDKFDDHDEDFINTLTLIKIRGGINNPETKPN